jgi:ribulose kinase
MVAAVSAGVYNDIEEAMEEWVTVTNVVQPIPEQAEQYAKLFANYLHCYKALDGEIYTRPL